MDMSIHGDRVITIIVLTGVLAFLLLLVFAAALNRVIQPNERERVVIRTKYSPFDSARAYRDLEWIVGLGPRPAGSEAAMLLRQRLKQELAEVGLRVWEHAFEADTPLGKRRMVNLVAVVEGTQPGVILLGNHYDTKHFTDFEFVGANDGGSTTAWMLEAARMFGPRREGRSLWLVWFDGEESFGRWSASDGLYGSRAFAEHLRAGDQLGDIHSMVNVDMIGDCYLHILRDRNAAPWLVEIVWDVAHRLGYGNHFGRGVQDIQDDDLPFRKAGVPTLLLIDFSYGGSIIEHRKNWHTEQDTLDKVCPESLQAVADVLYHALPAIEAHLNEAGNP